MNKPLEPLKVPNLKEACVQRLEELILSGGLKIGERLPAERDFAARIGVSRPVLHEALVDLHAKGLVQILPRRGVFVSDYRRAGSTAILSSLLAYHNGSLDPVFIRSLLDMRRVVESETARLAALQRTAAQVQAFHALLQQEALCDPQDARTWTELDFSFHLDIAIASGNLVYPLIINSFKGVYTSLSGQFFTNHPTVAADIRGFHARLVRAIQEQDAEEARQVMLEMLEHGESALLGGEE